MEIACRTSNGWWRVADIKRLYPKSRADVSCGKYFAVVAETPQDAFMRRRISAIRETVGRI
jgi:hypothetical protein